VDTTFLGYERPNGEAGIRNWVGVISVLDVANPITRAICRTVGGTIPITTLFVRGQYGRDLEISYNVLAGMGSNPNLASVLLIGLESTSTETVAERIRSSGKSVEAIVIQEAGGSISAMVQGIRKAMSLVIEASQIRRTPIPLSALTIGVECGGSDSTSGISANPAIGRAADRLVGEGGRVVISETAEFLGAEHIFAERAVSEEVRNRFLGLVLAHEKEAMGRGVDIRGTNPVPDNIRGGLTTIEEKALGAMTKAGTTPLVGVVEYGEPVTDRGMHFMATPAPAVESMTGLAAGGCQLILFATGVGNTIGNMVAPTIKVSGNINTVRTLVDDIDFDVSPILESGAPISEMGDSLFDYTVGVASGTVTKSEVIDQRETAVSRFEPTI
jgi:altronate dehydratase large subunit